MAAIGCDLNPSMQHLNSSYRDGDVEYEVQNEDLLLRRPRLCENYFATSKTGAVPTIKAGLLPDWVLKPHF